MIKIKIYINLYKLIYIYEIIKKIKYLKLLKSKHQSRKRYRKKKGKKNKMSKKQRNTFRKKKVTNLRQKTVKNYLKKRKKGGAGEKQTLPKLLAQDIIDRNYKLKTQPKDCTLPTKLFVFNVRGDGACLFSALLHGLINIDPNFYSNINMSQRSNKFRQDIMTWIEKNLDTTINDDGNGDKSTLKDKILLEIVAGDWENLKNLTSDEEKITKIYNYSETAIRMGRSNNNNSMSTDI